MSERMLLDLEVFGCYIAAGFGGSRNRKRLLPSSWVTIVSNMSFFRLWISAPPGFVVNQLPGSFCHE